MQIDIGDPDLIALPEKVNFCLKIVIYWSIACPAVSVTCGSSLLNYYFNLTLETYN